MNLTHEFVIDRKQAALTGLIYKRDYKLCVIIQFYLTFSGVGGLTAQQKRHSLQTGVDGTNTSF